MQLFYIVSTNRSGPLFSYKLRYIVGLYEKYGPSYIKLLIIKVKNLELPALNKIYHFFNELSSLTFIEYVVDADIMLQLVK